MNLKRRCATVVTLLCLFLVGPISPAHAAFWTVEASWFTSRATCDSRGETLFQLNQILTWKCTQNGSSGEYPYRYTLHIYKRQAGDPMPNAVIDVNSER